MPHVIPHLRGLRLHGAIVVQRLLVYCVSWRLFFHCEDPDWIAAFEGYPKRRPLRFGMGGGWNLSEPRTQLQRSHLNHLEQSVKSLTDPERGLHQHCADTRHHLRYPLHGSPDQKRLKDGGIRDFVEVV